MDESWADQLRRFDRLATLDLALHERRVAIHISTQPPVVKRHLIESTVRTTTT